MKNYLLTKKVLRVFLFSCAGFFAVWNSNAQVTTYTFTNAGATGAFGPSQAQINAAYLATNLNGAVTTNSAGVQQWTVPISGAYRIQAIGAKGGGTSFFGSGASMSGDFALTAGTVFKIVVGQMGGSGNNSHGSGGGGSFVATSTNSLLIAAGGGGGRGASSSGVQSTSHGTIVTAGQTPLSGAAPGGTGGGGGAAGNSVVGGTSVTPGGNSVGSDWASGGGGFYTNGGACNAGNTPGGYAFLTNNSVGGNASTTGGVTPGGFGGGGGCGDRGAGGGGFSGGGCGTNNADAGGGGGSFNSGLSPVNVSGVNAGQGSVIITRLCNITLNSSSNPICNGSSVSLTTDAISNYTWSTGSNAASIIVSPTVTTSYTLTAMSPSNCVTSAVITITVSAAAPVLTVTNSSPSVCLGNTATLTAAGALTYTWTGGVTNGVSFAPTVNQVYTVSGQNGCGIVTATTAITIAPLPVIGIASPTLVCAGTTATLSGGGATTYTWQPGNIVGASVLVSPQANTNYTVTGGTGSCIGIFTLNIATNPNPTLTATASQSINVCVGTSVTLTATGALGYTWQPGGLTGPSIVVTPTIPTAYVVTGTNNFNCSSNTSQVVITSQSPTVTAVTNNSILCLGGSATLTASGANSYAWNTGALTGVTVVSPIISTVYSVVGTNTTSGCSNTQTVSVSVFIATISVTPPTAVCLGASVTLNASGANSYTWSNGSNSSSIFVGPLVTTNYLVNGISNIGNMSCASSGSTAVTVNQLPSVAAVCTRTSICKNEFATITATGASTYLWSNSSTNTVLSVNPIVTTNYSVIGTNASGCVNTATIQIKVSNCVGIAEINNQSNSGILIFPNPSSGEFNIITEEAMELNLVNELGQSILTLDLNLTNNHQVKINHLAKGVYFLLSNNKDLSIHQKIVVSD